MNSEIIKGDENKIFEKEEIMWEKKKKKKSGEGMKKK